MFGICLPSKNLTYLLAEKFFRSNAFLFLFFMLGFAMWRYGYPLVWDDTSVYITATNVWQIDPRDNWFTTFLAHIIPSFSQVASSGYRPISSLFQSFSTLTINSPYPSWGHLLFVGSLFGWLALAFKSVASRFIKSPLLVYTALILFMFSAPVAQSSWISYTGIPILVPLLTCLGLLAYFNIIENSTEDRRRNYFLLSFIVIFSSLYREFMVALPLTILGMEIVRTWRITWFSILLSLLIIVCLFPTVIPFLLFKVAALVTGFESGIESSSPIKNGVLLPLLPVFKLGNVHGQLAGVFAIKHEVSRHFISILSPTLLALTLVGFITVVVGRFRQTDCKNKFSIENIFAQGIAVLGIFILISMLLPSVWRLDSSWLYHCAVLVVLLIAWLIDKRLTIWIAVYLGPFYLVYTERVHLAYVMMPLSITLIAVLERCWNVKQIRETPHKLMRIMVSVALVIGLVDAISNPMAVRLVMNHISTGIEKVAQNVKTLPSERPISIIGNALHVDDLRMYLDEGYQLLWTIPTGHARPKDVTETPAQLEKFLKAKLPTTDVYFLDMRYDFIPFKKGYHQHRFVAGCSVSMENLGMIHLTQAEYLIPDPLRWFTKREYYAFLGPPDLVDDFYYGPSKHLIFGRVGVEYHLYKVSSSEVKKWLPLSSVDLIDKNYFGFSIIHQNRRFFAIPANELPFAYENFCRNRYSMAIESSSLDEIKEIIKTANMKH